MNRIKELREKKGFTSIKEFAHFVENELHYPVSVATMVLLEKDKRMTSTKIIDGANPSYNLVKTLANYFGVSIEYMMNE